MSFYPFNTLIPAANNNPSQDQPDMLANNVSTKGILAEDHITFGNNFGGFHKQVTMSNQAAPGLRGANGVLYTNTFLGDSWPRWENTAGSRILMGPSSPGVIGYTYLPAGFIMQWGHVTPPGTSGSPAFSIAFPTATYGVFMDYVKTANAAPLTYHLTAVTTTGFSYASSSVVGPAPTQLFWWALGA